MNLRHVGILAGLLACAVAQQAAQSSSNVAIAVTITTDSDGPPLAGRLFLTPIDRVHATIQSAELSIPGTTVISVPAGQWTLAVQGDQVYDPGRMIRVTPDTDVVGGGGVRTATIAGHLHVPEGETPPTALDARWLSAEPTNNPSSGSVVCTTQDSRFSCKVPAIPLDLKLRAASYVSHFFPALKLKPSDVLDVGTLTLVHGSSIVGSVRSGATARVPLERVRVHALLQPQTDSAPVTVTPSPRGSFHVQGLTQGTYVVTARYDDLQSEPFVVNVKTNSESELLDPVILLPPAELRVQVRPVHVHHTAAPWLIRLRRVQSSSNSLETIGEMPVDDSGEAQWKRLLPGRYVATVSASPRSVFAQREFTIVEGANRETIDIDATRVTGRVLLGARGVRGTLWIGGKQTVPSVRVETGDDGDFETTVPLDPAETWPLFVESKAPRISVSLAQKPVIDGATDTVRLEVRLPGTVLTGKVQTEVGAPVTRAIVNVVPIKGEGEVLQTNVDATGSFDIAGLAPGVYYVQADDFQDQQSERMSVTIDSDGYAEVKLIVRTKDKLVGQVRSASGPLPNARLSALPTDRAFILIADANTDADGVFRMTVPPDTRAMDFTISANGFATKLLHIPAVASGLTFQLDHQGGEIVIDAPFIDDPAGLHPILVHRGAAISAWGLLDLAATQSETSSRGGHYMKVVHKLIDPGAYWLCMARIDQLDMLRADVQRGRCTSGYLTPYGRLELRAD